MGKITKAFGRKSEGFFVNLFYQLLSFNGGGLVVYEERFFG
jgi:hypothetical protein